MRGGIAVEQLVEDAPDSYRDKRGGRGGSMHFESALVTTLYRLEEDREYRSSPNKTTLGQTGLRRHGIAAQIHQPNS